MVETEDGFELESWETILVDDSIPGKPEILGLAVRTARSLVKKAQELPLEQALEAEATAFAGLFKGHDQKEGMQAFLQRRKPEFKGN